MSVTRTLATWAAETPDDWSDKARHRVRSAVIDTLGCMVAGAGDEGADRVRRAALAMAGGGPCRVVGSTERTSATSAALANGMSAHALDYDDILQVAVTHASAVMVPALLALAERDGLSGARLIDAYIVGLEVQGRIGLAVNPAHNADGWHPTGTIGTIGTAAACARLLGLSVDGLHNAIGLGASMASGVKAQLGSMAKPFHAGMAAQNGVMAAILASEGVTATTDPLAAPLGFLARYGGDEAPGFAEPLFGDGTPVIEAYGLSVKRFPCCGSAHRSLDGLLALKREHGITADDVTAVHAKVSLYNTRNLMYAAPQDELQARFSMNYVASVALVHGVPGLSDFTPDAVRRPEVRAVLDRIHMSHWPQEMEGADPASRKPAETTVALRNGSTVTANVLWPKGSAAMPLDEAEQLGKYHDCTRGLLDKDDADRLWQSCRDLDNLVDITELTRSLAFATGADRGERFATRPAAE